MLLTILALGDTSRLEIVEYDSLTVVIGTPEFVQIALDTLQAEVQPEINYDDADYDNAHYRYPAACQPGRESRRVTGLSLDECQENIQLSALP